MWGITRDETNQWVMPQVRRRAPGSFVQLGCKALVNLQNFTVGHLLVDRARRWKSFAQRDRLRGQDHLEA